MRRRNLGILAIRHFRGRIDVAASNKKAIEAVRTILDYCDRTSGCQNCIFRKHGADHWDCSIHVWDIKADFNENEILARINAKSCNHGYL